MAADLVEPQRPRVVDEHAEHAAPVRRVADRPPARVVEPAREEARQPLALRVEHPDRRIVRARELPRGVEQPVQHGVEVDLGDERAARVEQAREAVGVGGHGHRRD